MGILNMDDSNYTMQVWIAARYIEANSYITGMVGFDSKEELLSYPATEYYYDDTD